MTDESTASPDPAALLDDPARLGDLDPGGMLGHVARLGQQLRAGYRSAKETAELPSGRDVGTVVICGMGASGLGGDVFRSLYAARARVPIVVCKGYELPEFCGRDSLVIAMSFSGDTEETLAAYGEAVSRGCRVVAVSAAGELRIRSGEDDVPHVSIPADVPVPRAALGYLAAAPIGVLESAGVIPPAGRTVEAAAALVDGLAGRLGPDRPLASNPMKELAAWIGHRHPVVWASEGLGEAAALRFKNQVNENAKRPAFVATFPELDHNDIEGWSAASGAGFALIVLRNRGEHVRVAARVEATFEAIAASGLEWRQVWGEGSSPIEQLFSLIVLGDFASTYLALLLGVDPTPIPVLTSLKERLRG